MMLPECLEEQSFPPDGRVACNLRAESDCGLLEHAALKLQGRIRLLSLQNLAHGAAGVQRNVHAKCRSSATQ